MRAPVIIIVIPIFLFRLIYILLFVGTTLPLICRESRFLSEVSKVTVMEINEKASA
ncbi:MAG: hypothetical protein WCJ16_02245 [Actinomycetes bacterium]